MIYRSKAPLRIGLAGGGTDVSPYSDLYGGAILNITLSLYAHANIEPTGDGKITVCAMDRHESETYDGQKELPVNGHLDLLKGVYNRIRKDYGFESKGFRLSTYVDAPAGSGLGTSSTLVVAIIGAFAEMLKLPLGEYDIAHYAYDIERKDLSLSGGKQDQYAATFGGCNFMEFYSDDKVIVNPLRIREEYISELENNLLLYYTSTSRESAKIIEEQQKKRAFQQREIYRSDAQPEKTGNHTQGSFAQRRPRRFRKDTGLRIPAKKADGRQYFQWIYRRYLRDGHTGRSHRRENQRCRRRRFHDVLLSRQYTLPGCRSVAPVWRHRTGFPTDTEGLDNLEK